MEKRKGGWDESMDNKLMRRLREQTVQICDMNGNFKGTGFFVADNLVVTVHHCILNSNGRIVNPIGIFKGNKMVCEGIPYVSNDEIVFIYLEEYKQENRIPIGYCNNLEHGDKADAYGYPARQSEGYPLDDIEISGNFHEDGNEEKPSIQFLVRNKIGALDRYDGLSGSPMVVGDSIVGIAATADEGGQDTNALHFYDFSRPYIRSIFEKMNINMKEVLIARGNGEKNRNKATIMALYRRAWWITENTDRALMLCDQYSIVLGTLLLAVASNADIILASPWESGLAECLQEETQRYEKEIPCWKGRRWIEYDGAAPDWEKLGQHMGVVISVSAQNCTDILISGLLTGRRRLYGDVLVLWNIWSDQPSQSICQAVRAAAQFEGNARKDLLTVFSSWQMEEKLPYTFLVHETAHEWLKKQPLDELLQESFLLGLRPEETDAITWEVFRQYRENRTETWDGILRNLWQICSDSVKTLISFCEGEGSPEDLLGVEPSAIKRWFASVKEEDCSDILACLRNNRSLYWNAILINPYCTGYALREWCEQRTFAQLLLEQDVNSSNDVLLQDETDAIRRQIRPI